MGILDRFSLQGRIALVSGGAGPQFGSSISEALAEAGATRDSADGVFRQAMLDGTVTASFCRRLRKVL